MTADARADVAAEMRAADDAFRAAAALIDLGLIRDAASRLYYCAFHATRALLFSVGVHPRSHEALRTLFSRHFVKTGDLSADFSKLLANLESTRLNGDYDTEFSLGAEQLRPDVEKTSELLALVRDILLRGGWSVDS